MSELVRIDVVEDRTAESRCDEGFLRLRRLRLRNEYADGSRSAVYDCDVVSRRSVDAVVAVLYAVGEAPDGSRGVRVLLREGVRPPAYLRKDKHLVHGDLRVYTSLLEVVAGVLEDDDGPGEAGLCARAAIEALEEAGLAVPAASFSVLGGEAFASPGITDEKLFFAAAPVDVDGADGELAEGDGSVMEQGARLHVVELGEAIAACRRGEIPDMKTEVALLRLADHLGYLPQLGCFVHELPEALRAAHSRLGVAPA